MQDIEKIRERINDAENVTELRRVLYQLATYVSEHCHDVPAAHGAYDLRSTRTDRPS